MKLVVMSVYDKKAQAFKTPFYVQNVEMATRALTGAVNSQEPSDLTLYPEDFAMYHIATYDDELGKFVCPAQPIFIAEAMQFKKPVSVKALNLAAETITVKGEQDVRSKVA